MNRYEAECQGDEPRVSSTLQSDGLTSTSPHSRDLPSSSSYNGNPRAAGFKPSTGAIVTKELSRMINDIIIQEQSPSYDASQGHRFKSSPRDAAISQNGAKNYFSVHENGPSFQTHPWDELLNPGIEPYDERDRGYINDKINNLSRTKTGPDSKDQSINSPFLSHNHPYRHSGLEMNSSYHDLNQSSIPGDYFDPELAPYHYGVPEPDYKYEPYRDFNERNSYHTPRSDGDYGTRSVSTAPHEQHIDGDDDSWASFLEPLVRDRCNTWPLPKPAYLEPTAHSSKVPPTLGSSLAPSSIKEEAEDECQDEVTGHQQLYSFSKTGPTYDSRAATSVPGGWADTYDETFDLKLLKQHQQLVEASHQTIVTSAGLGEDSLQPLPELSPEDILLDDQHQPGPLVLRQTDRAGQCEPMGYQIQNSAFSPFVRSPMTKFNSIQSSRPVVSALNMGYITSTSAPSSAARKNAWGNYSYADLITKAIQTSPEKRLTLSQIYDWMVQYIPYFKDKGDSNSSAGWKNSIRHNLSLHNRFIRLQNEGAGKSSWWMLNPDAKPGKTARRRASTQDTKAYEKKRGRVRKRLAQSNALSSTGTGSCGYLANIENSGASVVNKITGVATSSLLLEPINYKFLSHHGTMEGMTKLTTGPDYGSKISSNTVGNTYTKTGASLNKPYELNASLLPGETLNSVPFKPPLLTQSFFSQHSTCSDSSPLTFSSSRTSLSPPSGKSSKELLYHKSPITHPKENSEGYDGLGDGSSSHNYLAMDYQMPEFRSRTISCAATLIGNSNYKKKPSDYYYGAESKSQHGYGYGNHVLDNLADDSHTHPLGSGRGGEYVTCLPRYNTNYSRSTSSLNDHVPPYQPPPYNYDRYQNGGQNDDNLSMDWSAKQTYPNVIGNYNNSLYKIADECYSHEQWQAKNSRFPIITDSHSGYHHDQTMGVAAHHKPSGMLENCVEQSQADGNNVPHSQLFERYPQRESSFYYTNDPRPHNEEPVVEMMPRVYLNLSEIKHECDFEDKNSPHPSLYDIQGLEGRHERTKAYDTHYAHADDNMVSHIDSMLDSNSVSSTRLNIPSPAMNESSSPQQEYSLLRQTLNKPFNQGSTNRLYGGSISSSTDMTRQTRNYGSVNLNASSSSDDLEGARLDPMSWGSHHPYNFSECQSSTNNNYPSSPAPIDYETKPYSPCREQVNYHESSHRGFHPYMTHSVSGSALVSTDLDYHDSSSSFG